MELLNIFTMGELVAITMVVLQLILVTVMLQDKCLWRISPSAGRARLEGQSNVDRARRSAHIDVPHGSSSRSSRSSRRRFPRFIRSSRDSQALFEEHRKELEAQLAQWPRVQRDCGAAQAEVPVEPGLLGGKESPQGPGEERPKEGMESAPEEDKAKAKPAGAGSGGSRELEGGSSTAMAWFIPGDVVIAEATVAESEGGGSSSSSSSLGLEFSIPSSNPWWGPAQPPAPRPQPLPAEPGRALGKLRAWLRGCLGAWWSRRRPPACCRRR